MDEIKLEAPKKVKVVFEGADYALSKPTLGATRDFARAMKDADSEDKKVDAMIGYLAALGLPSKVTEALEVEEIEKLIEALAPKKKS